MDPRYARNVPALSEAECELLQRKRVLVVGCGGLGGHLIDMLARIGIGSLRVVDGDAFEPSNLNRQLLSEVSLLGVGKAPSLSFPHPAPSGQVVWHFCFSSSEALLSYLYHNPHHWKMHFYAPPT